MSIPRRLHHLAKGAAETAWLVLCAPPIAFWAWLLGPKAEGPSGPPAQPSAIELDARRKLGIPGGHPERVVTTVYQGYLDGLQDHLWPGDELAAMYAHARREAERSNGGDQ